MIYFTADMHLGHDAIRRHCNRPFETVEEMDEQLISNWNSKVTSQDIVYHVGDFAWKNADYYLHRLNGNIVFILGNHDKAILAGKMSRRQIVKSHIHSITVKEKELSPTEDIDDLYPLKDKQHIVLCHYAMRSWDRSHYGTWLCFAHSHGRKEPLGKSYDVGVDNNGYYPLSYWGLRKIMNSLPEEKVEIERVIETFNGY